jgi:hypothetical protein
MDLRASFSAQHFAILEVNVVLFYKETGCDDIIWINLV